MNIMAARTSGESRPNMPMVEKAASIRWLKEWVTAGFLERLCWEKG